MGPAIAEEDRPCQELCESAVSGDAARCEKLLTDGVRDVNWQRPTDGNSALHLAAEEGHEPVVRALVAAKADPELTNGFGLKPISLVAGGTDIYNLLLRITRPVDERSERRGALCHGF